jgi:hypothetical protein
MMLCFGALWLAMSTPSMSAIAASTASRGACTAAIGAELAPFGPGGIDDEAAARRRERHQRSKSIAPPANRATNSP